jgi:hypothetical protein
MVMQNPRLVEQSRMGTDIFVLDNAGKPGLDVLETRGTAISEMPTPDSQSIAPSGN